MLRRLLRSRRKRRLFLLSKRLNKLEKNKLNSPLKHRPPRMKQQRSNNKSRN
jgi:hypothetical protein